VGFHNTVNPLRDVIVRILNIDESAEARRLVAAHVATVKGLGHKFSNKFGNLFGNMRL